MGFGRRRSSHSRIVGSWIGGLGRIAIVARMGDRRLEGMQRFVGRLGVGCTELHGPGGSTHGIVQTLGDRRHGPSRGNHGPLQSAVSVTRTGLFEGEHGQQKAVNKSSSGRKELE